jgi:glycosyltransferase involved in cell wall biosynthesis
MVAQAIRVCMISSTPIPPREGIGFYVWNLSRFLTQLGHHVHIVTRGGYTKTTREVIQGVTVWKPTFLPVFPFHVQVHGIFVNRVIRELESEIDVIHLHTPLVGLPKTQVPTLVTVHNPMKTDVRQITENNLFSTLIRLQAPFSFRVEQQLFDAAGGLTAVAKSVARELIDYQVDPACVHVLGNGVDTSVFYPSDVTPDESRPYALTVARLAPRKGLLDLIPAAAQVTREIPDFRFLIAGSGPLEGDLVREIERRGLMDRVVLLGHIAERARLVDLYRRASVYVHPAHYEGLPTVLLEAMACGTPVIATAVSGALDVLEHGRNGLLVPPKAPNQLAQAILQVMRTPGMEVELGKAAARTAAEHFAWPNISHKFVDQYQSLLAEYRRARAS